MTLTEQWRKGELKFGAYYVNRLEEHRVWLYNDRSKTPESQHEIYEILAPVPAYDEWQQLHKFLEEFNALEVAKENQQLKELIKEIRSLWKGTICMPDSQEQVRDILTKIDNAIGEKK